MIKMEKKSLSGGDCKRPQWKVRWLINYSSVKSLVRCPRCRSRGVCTECQLPNVCQLLVTVLCKWRWLPGQMGNNESGAYFQMLLIETLQCCSVSLRGGSVKIWDLHGLISTSDNIMGPWPNVKQNAITITYSGASWNENWLFIPLNNVLDIIWNNGNLVFLIQPQP